eukprot:GHVU01213556.1.p3 GENE.GHVU01213556.1~~GHVU01213556.1.p3  ORF type:complete len:107 (+),score=29.40 GHVU01213556.1:683-1003(+)
MNMIEKRKQQRGQGGFTLIELLVVVAILAILAGVVLFAVGNLTDDADEYACKVERDTIKTAIAAAEATSDAADTSADYLDGTPKYFTGSGATWTKVTGAPAGCPDV